MFKYIILKRQWKTKRNELCETEIENKFYNYKSNILANLTFVDIKNSCFIRKSIQKLPYDIIFFKII